MPSAFGVSVTIHLALAAIILAWAGLQPEEVASKAPPIPTDLVFIQQAGDAGGGGGNPAPAPPSRIEIPAHTTPVVPTEAVVTPVDPPKPTLDVMVQTNLATSLQASGTTLLAPPGPGGGGRGTTGAGSGDGPGVGPGTGGNFGGGPRGVGNGVSSPIDKRQVKPAYTACALAAKIQGNVTMDVVVLADGTVGDVKIVGSLDKKCGLDLEAIKAARQWLFVPGTFEGKPVDVLVQLILTFNLR